jgi:hypothetical protein
VADGRALPLAAESFYCVVFATLCRDPWLVRRLVPLVRDAGFEPGPVHSHGHIEETAPTYLLGVIDLGADTLAPPGVIAPATAEALKAKARHRVAAGRVLRTHRVRQPAGHATGVTQPAGIMA